jgi:UDP-galactopyranose mutase
MKTSAMTTLFVFSHLRWDFVFQRPQHLMTRLARRHRVCFLEEPVFAAGAARLERRTVEHNITLLRPHTPIAEPGFNDAQIRAIRPLLHGLLEDDDLLDGDVTAWFYTPMALPLLSSVQAQHVVYDCMDELSAFKNADPALPGLERALLRRADLVITGGQSLYEAKKHQHHNIHPMPSSVDVEHFAKARRCKDEPADQCAIARPRLGFFGVIDERLDIALLKGLADAKPDWQIVMIGPIVKIDPADLPRRNNIHYLGPKSYLELPRYIAGWDVALLLFARNDATRFISPTKTPEYLAAGKPVVSTSIRDVVNPYGEMGLVRIADTVQEFGAACEAALREPPAARRAKADAYLKNTSWDRTWSKTALLLKAVLDGEPAPARSPRAPSASLSLGA